jgi:hypothetical protein
MVSMFFLTIYGNKQKLGRPLTEKIGSFGSCGSAPKKVMDELNAVTSLHRCAKFYREATAQGRLGAEKRSPTRGEDRYFRCQGWQGMKSAGKIWRF